MASRLCDDDIEKVSSDSGPISGFATDILPGQDTFSADSHPPAADLDRWIRANRSRKTVNALQLLRDDHREVEALFRKFEKTGPRGYKRRGDIVGRIIAELAVHAAIEEQVLYPQVRERLPEAESDVLEALEEHHIVKWTLSELDGMDPRAERFEAKVMVLIESVRHHVKEEEDELFPKVRSALSRTELEQLGAELMAAKRIAPTRPHPRSPDVPPGNLVAAAVTAPLDAARSVGQAAIRRVREAAN
jgi:hemerythrin superfamily protein